MIKCFTKDDKFIGIIPFDDTQMQNSTTDTDISDTTLENNIVTEEQVA